MATASPETLRSLYQQELLAIYRTLEREAGREADSTDSVILDLLARQGVDVDGAPLNPETAAVAAMGQPANFWQLRGFGPAPPAYTLDPSWQQTASDDFLLSQGIAPGQSAIATSGGDARMFLSIAGLPTGAGSAAPARDMADLVSLAGSGGFYPATNADGSPLSVAGVGGGRINVLALVAVAAAAWYLYSRQ